MNPKFLVTLLVICALFVLSNSLHALAGSWPLQMVTVGDAGNAPEPISNQSFMYSDSSVPTNYQIGKYTITVGQYCDFLNAIAAADPYDCYSTNMETPLTNIFTSITNDGTNNFTNYTTNVYQAFISRSGTSGSYVYAIIGDYSNISSLPITYLDWFKAARFCNWMYHYCPKGPQDSNTTEAGCYFMQDQTYGLPHHMTPTNPNATWLIPLDNQWRKAAYYKGGSTNAGYWAYPTKSNLPPGNTIGDTNPVNMNANWMNYSTNYATAGTIYSNSYLTPVGLFSNSPGPYGTYDMCGNVQELINHTWTYWINTETLGGSFASVTINDISKGYIYAYPSNTLIGFRIAAPTSTVSSDYMPQ